MIRNFFRWNEKNFGKRFDASVVFRGGVSGKIGEGVDAKRIIKFGDDLFYVKVPHSRFFKNNKSQFSAEESRQDNALATVSELLAEKRYRSFKIPYAHYEVIKQKGLYRLISKDISNEFIEIKSLYELSRYEDDRISRYSSWISSHYLEQILDSPGGLLKIMTPECYDQFVMLIIGSVFDVSDDDHFNNVLFVRDQNSDRFQSLFVCDKESNAFNPLLVRNFDVSQAQYYSSSAPISRGIIIAQNTDNFNEKVDELIRLVKLGKMPKRFIKFLNKIAGFDFEKAASEIEMDFGIKPDPKQIEMYKSYAKIAKDVANFQK